MHVTQGTHLPFNVIRRDGRSRRRSRNCSERRARGCCPVPAPLTCKKTLVRFWPRNQASSSGDLETVPDLGGFAAANDLVGNTVPEAAQIRPPPCASGVLHARLQTQGWASFALGHDLNSLPDTVLNVASALGTIATRRGRSPIEMLSPRCQTNARTSSLSRRFGTGAFPLHCDTAHWTIPCRYIVLACEVAGRVETPTLLLDTCNLPFSDEEVLVARSATFIVKNGRNSFYASIIDRDRRFLRIDPGCMEPVTEAGISAMSLYQLERNRHRVISFAWKPGDVLIIDNWRVLHGRGNRVAADPRRRLVRAYVQ